MGIGHRLQLVRESPSRGLALFSHSDPVDRIKSSGDGLLERAMTHAIVHANEMPEDVGGRRSQERPGNGLGGWTHPTEIAGQYRRHRLRARGDPEPESLVSTAPSRRGPPRIRRRRVPTRRCSDAISPAAWFWMTRSHSAPLTRTI